MKYAPSSHGSLKFGPRSDSMIDGPWTDRYGHRRDRCGFPQAWRNHAVMLHSADASELKGLTPQADRRLWDLLAAPRSTPCPHYPPVSVHSSSSSSEPNPNWGERSPPRSGAGTEHQHFVPLKPLRKQNNVQSGCQSVKGVPLESCEAEKPPGWRLSLVIDHKSHQRHRKGFVC